MQLLQLVHGVQYTFTVQSMTLSVVQLVNLLHSLLVVVPQAGGKVKSQ